jgi:hypothetical protein
MLFNLIVFLCSFNSFIPIFRLLEDMDMRVDNTKSKLDMGLKRMNDFIQANSGMSSFPSYFIIKLMKTKL